MPDLPTIGGGPAEAGSTPGTSSGISITAGGSNNAKNTTFTTLIAATTYETNWLLITARETSIVGLSSGYLIDIAVGAAAAEQILIPNLHVHQRDAAIWRGHQWLMPLRVPRGTRISARCQCSTGAGTIKMHVIAFSSSIDGPPGLSRCEASGAVTATSRGTPVDSGGVAHTDVTLQFAATTGFAYRWMCLEASNATDIALTANTSFLVDVLTGAGGSEVVVVPDLWFSGTTGDDAMTPVVQCFPCNIAAGARLALRARCSITTASERASEYVIHGVG
jgi:hypothetical protein